VSYELTGSELIALLLESDEIKKHKPIFNRAQRRSIFSYGLFEFTDEKGYRNLRAGHQLNGQQAITSFTSAEHARNYLYGVIEKFELCQKLCGLYETQGACFHYSIKQCRGACIGRESADAYNRRVGAAIRLSGFMQPDFFIVDQGRNPEEAAIIKIAGGRYCGFGYADLTAGLNQEMLTNCVSPYKDNRDTHQIIQNYLKKKPRTKIIKVQAVEEKNQWYE
jgi:DNA polymerase-3 subunit epsilon